MTLHSIITRIITSIFGPLIPVLLSVALAYTLYGGFKYISAGDNLTDRKKAQGILMWGVIGLFVMVSIWGIVLLVVETFPDLNNSGLNAIPLRTGQ